MNEILVLYKSKYGSTKKYANWIKNDIPCDVFELDNFPCKDLVKYSSIIVASGIYGGSISSIKFVKKNIDKLCCKKIAILVVGASPYNEEAFEQIKRNILKNIAINLPIFYARGGYYENGMSFKDKSLCKMLKKFLSKKDPSTFDPWMKPLVETEDGKIYDWTDKSQLTPILKFITTK